MTNNNQPVVVYGAYGHTGNFVVNELLARGWAPVLSGRNPDQLLAYGARYPDLEIRPASVDDPHALDDALAGAAAVINCAGPFLDTALPLVESALRQRVHYVDMTAEQQCVLTIYERFTEEAQDKEVVILPAMAFYGGLADLLATAAMGEAKRADTIDIAVALDRWQPTRGTRRTGQRNTHRRLTYTHQQLVPLADPPPTRPWHFSDPLFGVQEVEGFPLSEIITLSKHLNVNEINTYINRAPVQDIHDQETPPPEVVDERGRSAQVFLMEVAVRAGGKIRRATATGQDIYAVTAPLVVEATRRIVEGRMSKTGVVAAGEAFDARDFIRSLPADYLSVDLSGI